jgi:hypothetical protein
MATVSADQVRLLVEENVGRKLEDFNIFHNENEVCMVYNNNGIYMVNSTKMDVTFG